MSVVRAARAAGAGAGALGTGGRGCSSCGSFTGHGGSVQYPCGGAVAATCDDLRMTPADRVHRKSSPRAPAGYFAWEAAACAGSRRPAERRWSRSSAIAAPPRPRAARPGSAHARARRGPRSRPGDDARRGRPGVRQSARWRDDGWLGPLERTAAAGPRAWPCVGRFYAEARIAPLVRLGRDRGVLDDGRRRRARPARRHRSPGASTPATHRPASTVTSGRATSCGPRTARCSSTRPPTVAPRGRPGDARALRLPAPRAGRRGLRRGGTAGRRVARAAWLPLHPLPPRAVRLLRATGLAAARYPDLSGSRRRRPR